MKRNVLVGAVLAAGLVVGGGAAFAAQHDAPPQQVSAGARVAASTTVPGTHHGARGAARHAKHDALADVLDGLVANGTITRAQADAITKAMAAKRADMKKSFADRADKRRGELGGIRTRLRDLEKSFAAAFGLTPEQLRSALHDGKTFDDLAKAHGTTLDAVAEKVTAQLKAEVQQKVAAGTLTQEQATRLNERLDQMVQGMLSGELATKPPARPAPSRTPSTPPSTNAPTTSLAN